MHGKFIGTDLGSALETAIRAAFGTGLGTDLGSALEQGSRKKIPSETAAF